MDIRRLVFCTSFALALAVPAFAADQPAPRTLSVSGMGEVKSAPDESNLSAGVTTQATTAAQALVANSRAMNAVFATLKRLGIPEKDIQTSDFSVQPQYQSCKPGTSCQPRIVGYQVSNTVDVTVEDMDKTGAVLDALVSSGSNQIGGINFSIHDPKPLLRTARAAAVADAIERAQTYAKAAGITLGPILSIDENGNEATRHIYKVAAGYMANAAPAPIAGGEESVSVNVTVTWQIQ
ncbi:MAG: SIMPL domain-containing protein [Rhizomicrobium sp.]